MAEGLDIAQSVDIAALAREFGISSQHLRRVLDQRGVSRAGHGQVELLAATRAYVASVRDGLEQRRARVADGDQLQAAKIHTIEARNERADAALIDISEHRGVAAEHLAALRRLLGSAATKSTSDQAMRRLLKNAFEQVLTDAERRFEDGTRQALAASRKRGR